MRIHFLYENSNLPGKFNPQQDKSSPQNPEISKPPLYFSNPKSPPPPLHLGGIEAIESFNILYNLQFILVCTWVIFFHKR